MLVLEFDLAGETISVLKTKKVNELIDENIRKLIGRKFKGCFGAIFRVT